MSTNEKLKMVVWNPVWPEGPDVGLGELQQDYEGCLIHLEQTFGDADLDVREKVEVIFKLQSKEENMSSECPSCGSMNIDSFTRTVKNDGGGFFGGGGGGIFDSLTGGGGGGGTTEELYYQCGDCGHEWT